MSYRVQNPSKRNGYYNAITEVYVKMINVTCPFCNQSEIPAKTEFSTGNTEIKCSICGIYFISKEALKDLPAEFSRSRSNKLPPKYIISGILRDNFERGIETPLITIDTINTLVDPGRMPSGINEQLRHLMRHIASRTEYYGQILQLVDTDYPLGFCKNKHEFSAMVNALKEKQWIVESSDSKHIGSIAATINGLAEVEKSEHYQKESNRVFIAMQFNNEMLKVYEQFIKPAVIEAGYDPLIILEKHHNNDINNEIIAEIRRSRFLIADLTGHRGGVYFEAGFAFGLGIPVIWSCKSDWFNIAVPIKMDVKYNGDDIEVMINQDRHIHFDVNHYPFIKWETGEQLRKELYDRIRATIV